MTLDLIIEPAYIPYSGERLGNLTLMEHQREAKDSDEKLLILDAPTSSGKTLAMLARFMETRGNGVFLYPTNELIKDQGRGIQDLLNEIGITSTIVPLEKEVEGVEADVDVIIPVVTGDSLEGLADTKGEAIRQILHMIKGEQRMLMLTNVDTLLLLFKMQYKGGRSLLSELLSLEYSVLAIDELHLYSGVAFANLFYLTWLLRDRFNQIIVSSATLQDSTKILQEVFEEYRIIKPPIRREDGHARQIRHKLNLSIGPSSGILSRDDLDELVEDVNRLFNPNSTMDVDTLIIVNSVVLSEELSGYLENIYGSENVGVINGLVPTDLREQRVLTVGTSAVEVGVDFDVNNLVFEGTNIGSFIQRLGRAGRHRDGHAVAYVPTGAYRKLQKLFEEDETRCLAIEELTEYASKTIPHLDNYTDFSKSIYGAVLFTAILYKVEKESLNRYNPPEIRQGIEAGWQELRPPFFKENVLTKIFNIARPEVIDIISEGGARGDILSTPVFLERYGVYSRMDILDLPRTIFYFEDVSNIDVPRPSWMRPETKKVAVIKGFKERSWLQGSWRGPLLNKNTEKILFAKTLGGDTTLSLHLDDASLEKKAEELLDGKIAYSTTTNGLTDWRFPRIYHSRFKNQCLVIGLDALVQKYVEESRA